MEKIAKGFWSAGVGGEDSGSKISRLRKNAFPGEGLETEWISSPFTASLTKETHHLMNTKSLALMRRSSVLLNLSPRRGR